MCFTQHHSIIILHPHRDIYIWDMWTYPCMSIQSIRCFSVTEPRTFPEPQHSSASHGFSTVECFGFSKGAKTSTVWLLWPSVFTVSLNTMSSNKKKSSNIPFCYNFHSLGGGKSLCFNPRGSVQPSLVQEPSVYLGGLVRLHSIPLFSLCMVHMSACTAYLSYLSTYQHRGSSTEGH